jgi:hypothetical protein
MAASTPPNGPRRLEIRLASGQADILQSTVIEVAQPLELPAGTGAPAPLRDRVRQELKNLASDNRAGHG